MKTGHHIDVETYKWLLQSINQMTLHESRRADDSDLNFVRQGDWLSESAVLAHINKRKGTWCIDLVFAYPHEPLRLLIRKIATETSWSKACLRGAIFQRQAAKDQRGTIEPSLDAFSICNN
jgi:hypothetical protein